MVSVYTPMINKKTIRIYAILTIINLDIAFITIMVNNKTHPKYSLTPYAGFGSRKIDIGGRLYDLSEVKASAKSENIYLVTQDCEADVANLGWDTTDISILINKLSDDQYEDSEWCKIQGNQHYPCDAYVITFDSFIVALNKFLPCTYYIKLALSTGGNLVFIVSCHV